MTKIIICDWLASRKRNEFIAKNYSFSKEILDEGEVKLRNRHKNGKKSWKI
jgi:hypothetical protein